MKSVRDEVRDTSIGLVHEPAVRLWVYTYQTEIKVREQVWAQVKEQVWGQLSQELRSLRTL